MRSSRTLAVVLLLMAACAARKPVPSTNFSGFLDDYSILHKGGPGDVALIYRDPDAPWTSYDKVLFEPVTLWRSGRHSLDPVPEGDLLRLVTDLEAAVRRHLGDRFALVEEPQAGTM